MQVRDLDKDIYHPLSFHDSRISYIDKLDTRLDYLKCVVEIEGDELCFR